MSTPFTEVEITPQFINTSDVPKGYKCIKSGVQKVADGDEPPEIITFKPVGVVAVSKDESSNNWGRLVKWLDLDEDVHEIAIPIKLFHAQGTELAQQLADGGLPIQPGKERALLRYLAAFSPAARLVSATCTGWLNGSFVLPSETINEPEGNRIVYQPGGFSNISKAIHRGGTIDDWKAGMASVSPVVIFQVCASLSAPIRFKVGVEAGGFHGYGLTSQGKTTVLQAAASVWGCGVDPAIAGGNDSVIHRWNSTANALEAKAVAFNDLAMCLDEIGEGDAREFGATIYRLLSGTGRGRSKRDGGLRDSHSWRTTVLSMGEIAVSDFIETGGKRIKGGQLVRVVDIDLSAMPPMFDNATQANAMKKLCATHYGHAGPELLSRVPDLASEWDTFEHEAIGPAESSITERVRARFALVAYAGCVAVKAGILPWTVHQILDAVRQAYKAWKSGVNVVSDIDRGIVSVRDFILRNEALFEVNTDRPPRDRAGWYREDMYHFTPMAFKEACGGVDATKVKRALNDEGLLHKNKPKGLSAVITVDGKSVIVVSVKSEILSSSSKKGGNSGNGGNKPSPARDSSVTTQGDEVVTGGNAAPENPDGVTTVTTQGDEVVTPQTRMNKGPLPPLPPLPPKSDELGFEYDYPEAWSHQDGL